MPNYFIQPLDYAQANPDKAHKQTFLETPRLLAGLTSLAPGQTQAIHDHSDQDKFYLVLAGTGRFTVGDSTQVCGAGMLVLAPAAITHGVRNESDDLLTFLTVIAPWH